MVVDKVFLLNSYDDPPYDYYIVRTTSKRYFKFKSIYDLLSNTLELIEIKSHGYCKEQTLKVHVKYVKYKNNDRNYHVECREIEKLSKEEVMNQVLLNT